MRNTTKEKISRNRNKIINNLTTAKFNKINFTNKIIV